MLRKCDVISRSGLSVVAIVFACCLFVNGGSLAHANGLPATGAAWVPTPSGCPPHVTGIGGVNEVCKGPPVLDCVALGIKWGDYGKHSCLTGKSERDQYVNWRCNTVESHPGADCYAGYCRDDWAFAAALARQASDIIHDVKIPITAPAAMPEALLFQTYADNATALMLTRIAVNSTLNAGMTCGYKTADSSWGEAAYNDATKSKGSARFSFVFGGSILFPAKWTAAAKAAEYGDLLLTAVKTMSQYRTRAQRRAVGFSYGKKAKHKAKVKWSLSPLGRLSLEISP